MKSTILLATAIFLASAPSPDSQSISEISAGFMSVSDSQSLMASEAAIKGENDLETSRLLAARSIAGEPDEATMKADGQTDHQDEKAAKDQL